MCMELGADVLNHLFFRAGVHPAFGQLTGTSLNDFLPLYFGVGIHGVVEAGDELTGQIGPVLYRQSQHFGNFFGGHTHTKIVSRILAD